MIAMALAMALLSFCLYFYRYAVIMETELKKEEGRAFRERLFFGRLTHVFSHLEEDAESYFFTLLDQPGISKGTSVIFSYKSDSLSPTFHGSVIGQLLVDLDKRLLLATWQNNQLLNDDTPPPLHLEVLYENVDTIEYEFLMGSNKVNTIHPEWKPGIFVPTWKDDFKTVPSAIKIKINRTKEFAFPIASCPSRPIKKPDALNNLPSGKKDDKKKEAVP